jgi:copper homeostasis protein
VIGLLEPDGGIDVPRTRELLERARPLSVTFHRAFDVARDPERALGELIAMGVDRLLTTGQEPTILEGLELVAALSRQAGRRLIVMPGGVNERNVARVVLATGASEIHVTGTRRVESVMRHRNERVFMGGVLRPAEYAREITDPESIRRLRGHAGDHGMRPSSLLRGHGENQ